MRPRHSLFRTAAAAALWLLVAGTWPALAGEAEAPATEATSEAETEEGAERAEAPPRETAPANASEESPEVFIPSEDISEDISVRFPVDI